KMATCPWESDTRLIYTFAKAGRYQIQVYDTQFKGGPNYAYRLTLGKIPTLTEDRPHTGLPGLTMLLLHVKGPNYTPQPDGLRVTIPEGTPPGDCWVAPETPTGTLLPLRFYYGVPGREWEEEPNDPPAPG